MIAKALLTDSLAILRLKISIYSLPFAKEIIFIKESATVVTLTPPPVDPGEAPIHISNMIRKIVGAPTKLKSILL
ncbi:hypothetical protein D3C73_682750 [compost metagenome]